MYWMIVLYVSKTGGVVPVKGKEGVGRRRHASMVTKSTRYTHSLQSAGGKHYQHIFTQNTHAYKQNGYQVHQIHSLLTKCCWGKTVLKYIHTKYTCIWTKWSPSAPDTLTPCICCPLGTCIVYNAKQYYWHIYNNTLLFIKFYEVQRYTHSMHIAQGKGSKYL